MLIYGREGEPAGSTVFMPFAYLPVPKLSISSSSLSASGAALVGKGT